MSLRPSRPAVLGVPALLLAALVPGHAQAAQSYDTCTGFIDSLPTTITTPGTWCLRKDLATSVWQGDAITIAADDVTVDCHDFKIGGLGAGPKTNTNGINSLQYDNVRVRRCNIRGFMIGINTGTGHGLRIEDNRLEGNTSAGISAKGYDGVIARNVVRDTGGSTSYPARAAGISVWYSVDVIDNTISGVAPILGNDAFAAAYGIDVVQGKSNRITGNRVRGLVALGTPKLAVAVNVQSATGLAINDNQLVGPGVGTAVQCVHQGQASVYDNILGGFPAGVATCDDGGNDYTP